MFWVDVAAVAGVDHLNCTKNTMWDLVKRRTHIELTIIAKPAMSMALL